MSDRPDTRSEDASSSDSFTDVLKTIVYALLIALIFRTLLFQPFSIPSGSMKSTLLIGDYLFVSKYSYGYSKYSLPMGRMVPDWAFPGRIFASDPERGDVVVFRNPNELHRDYIKRVIGVPGDRVQLREGVLYVNGEAAQLDRDGFFREPRTGKTHCMRALSDAAVCVKERFIETLPNGIEHTVLNTNRNRSSHDNTCTYLVPDGHFFFLGDNRDHSLDSRFGADRAHLDCAGALRPPSSGGPGLVPAELLIGRAEIIFLSSEGSFWELWKWRSDRFFKSID